jgi:hypothetical protein
VEQTDWETLSTTVDPGFLTSVVHFKVTGAPVKVRQILNPVVTVFTICSPQWQQCSDADQYVPSRNSRSNPGHNVTSWRNIKGGYIALAFTIEFEFVGVQNPEPRIFDARTGRAECQKNGLCDF